MLAALYQNNYKTENIEYEYQTNHKKETVEYEEDPEYFDRCYLRFFLRQCANNGQLTEEQTKILIRLLNNTYKNRGKM